MADAAVQLGIVRACRGGFFVLGLKDEDISWILFYRYEVGGIVGDCHAEREVVGTAQRRERIIRDL